MTPAAAPGLARIARAASPLALAVTVLLFLQWPLRDLVGAGSTQANDLAQWLFALYVAVAVAHAQRRGEHLVARPDLAAQVGRGRRAGAALCLLLWSVYLVGAALPLVWHSLLALERFPESLTPGYFMIKVALLLLGTLLAWQSAAELIGAWRTPAR